MKTCTKCNEEKEDSLFRKKRRICLECHSRYNKEYRTQNKDKIKKVHDEYWEKEGRDKRRESVRNSEERTIESFLAVQARSVRHRCKDPKKRSFANYEECDITTEYLMDLWNKKDGKCALTGLQMNYKTGNLYTVSVDRIDSGGSYLKGNVQLVCKGANFLKNKHTQEETMQFIGDTIQKSEVMKDIAYFLRKIQSYLDKDDDACGAKRDLKRAMLLIDYEVTNRPPD